MEPIGLSPMVPAAGDGLQDEAFWGYLSDWFEAQARSAQGEAVPADIVSRLLAPFGAEAAVVARAAARRQKPARRDPQRRPCQRTSAMVDVTSGDVTFQVSHS